MTNIERNIGPRADGQLAEPLVLPLPSAEGLNAGWLRLVMDSMSEGFGLLAPDFIILELNKEAVRLDRRARSELIGQSHWLAYPGTEHSAIGAMYKKTMAERVAASLGHSYHWPDGRMTWLETRVFPVENGCIAVFFRDVTDRYLALQQLRSSERRFRAAVSAIEGVLWTNDPDGRMVGRQAGWASLTGQSYEEYQGHGWARAVHPDDAQRTVDAWQAAVGARKPFACEHRVRGADGLWRLYSVRAVPVLDEEGAITEWVGIHRDITETRASALRLQQLAESTEAVFYVHEIEEGRISYVSRAYESIWGQSREELYSNPRNFLKGVHPGDLPQMEEAMRQQQAGQCTHMEYRLLREDGSERIIQDRPFETTDPVSGKRRIVGLANDITEHRRAQQQLARNAETFSNLVVSNPFGIYVVDSDLRLRHVSQGARKVFASVTPLVGRDFAEILTIVWTQPFAGQVMARFRHTLATGEPYVSHQTIETRADIGAVEAYDWRIERITLPDGRFGVVCYFYDLSERNAYEAKLTQALADKDLLAREIDHRVKNSLTIVASMLSMQRNASLSDETRAALDDAADRVVAVARVHEQLHRSAELGVVAFGAYLRQLCGDLAASMRRPEAEVDCRVDAVDLPAETALSLALIANELITNAFKHGCAAGATRIAVTLMKDGDGVTLTVSDNGRGIPADFALQGSLGFKLIGALGRQLQANATFPEPGGKALFRLELSAKVLQGG